MSEQQQQKDCENCGSRPATTSVLGRYDVCAPCHEDMTAPDAACGGCFIAGSISKFRERYGSMQSELSRLEAENARLREENEARAAFMERRGYRRCDIPACNCNGWHGGHAEQRLGEIEDALMDADIDTNGKTILAGVKEATSKLSALIASVRDLAASYRELERFNRENFPQLVEGSRYAPEWQIIYKDRADIFGRIATVLDEIAEPQSAALQQAIGGTQ